MANIDRVLQAVDDPEWQAFRKSLKGTSTEDKLRHLWGFWTDHHGNNTNVKPGAGEDCDTCVQVDNYLKALARGGQLHPGVNLTEALNCQFKLDIRRN